MTVATHVEIIGVVHVGIVVAEPIGRRWTVINEVERPDSKLVSSECADEFASLGFEQVDLGIRHSDDDVFSVHGQGGNDPLVCRSMSREESSTAQPSGF